jgi:Tfp pilus assembly protein PilX
MSRAARAWADQRGMVLPLTLMFVVILTTLSVALLTVGGQESVIAANHLKGVHALFLAEAGLEDAFNAFRNNTALLTTSVPSSLTTLSVSGPGTTLSAYGGYSVQYHSAGSNTVRVVVTGYTGTSSAQTATRVLRAMVTVGFTNSDAVRTKGNLRMSGNPAVTGTCGSAHTNDDLTISGNPSVAGTATASDQYSVSGNPTVGSGSGGGKAQKTIPTVSASSFLTQAKATVAASQIYQFLSDGKVRDGNDNLITTLSNNDTYRGWKYKSSGPNWEYNDNTGYDGTYYFQGEVKVSGNPGSAATPWNVTIIATGSIKMSGSPHMNVHSLDTLLMSDDDVDISGNGTMYEAGAIIAKDSVEISGNPTILGYVLAAGTSESKISGNPTITYNCGVAPPIIADVTILASGF